ncbi:MAG: hypothetical protein Q7J38_02075 [Gallionella sp.]|nr:hypothetical protein [Gallionella sp.]
MHLTERIVAQHCSDIHIGAQQDENSLFSFDMDHPAAPMRVKVGATVHTSTRFIGMAAMQPKLDSMVKALGKGVVPENLNLGGTYDAELVREAAQFLLDYLAEPPLRRNGSVESGLDVVRVLNLFQSMTGVAFLYARGFLACLAQQLRLGFVQPVRGWRLAGVAAALRQMAFEFGYLGSQCSHLFRQFQNQRTQWPQFADQVVLLGNAELFKIWQGFHALSYRHPTAFFKPGIARLFRST